MNAYHGDPAIKAKYIARVRAHREADRLIRGVGWADGRGCAIGCTLEAYDHARYETELGIPAALARLEDRIFEGLPAADSLAWPERFLSAITPGADLSTVWPRLAIWLLTELAPSEQGTAVAALYRRRLAGDEPTKDAWASAAAAAAAASAAARAAAWGRIGDRLIALLEECRPPAGLHP